MTVIGNSGFEYEEIYKKRSGYGRNRGAVRTCKIINLKTKEELFTLIGTSYNYKNKSWEYIKSIPSKRFLGMDNRYYYIEVSSKKIDWGQIQSDGAVLRPNRTIMTVIAFFPNYREPETTVPVNKPVIVTDLPYVPTVITIPKTISPIKTAIPVIPAIPDTPPVKDEISWIQKIIKKIIDWMKKILNR